MHWISFAWMTPSLLAGRKTVTRREWSEGWAARFHAGDQVVGYNRQPRFGGRKVAIVRLTADPYREHTQHMPDSDYECEGFAYLHEHPELVKSKRFGDFSRGHFHHWRMSGGFVYVVRFELVKVL